MTQPIQPEDDLDTVFRKAYPTLTEEELAEARLDWEMIARWLLEQVELGNPALYEDNELPTEEPSSSLTTRTSSSNDT